MGRSPDTFLIWGAGGHGKVVADLIRACGHRLAGFVDADANKAGRKAEPQGALVILTEDEFLRRARECGRLPDGIDAVALAVGDNGARQRCVVALEMTSPSTLVHPSALVSPSATLGPGTVVFPAAVINAGAHIGTAVIINSAAVVEHDCVVADCSHVSPNATLAGGVRIGERSWIGAGATVVQGIVIGTDVTVGAGAVVIRDVPDGTTVVGVPASPIQQRI